MGETDGTNVGDTEGATVGIKLGNTLGLLVGNDDNTTSPHTSSTSPYTPGEHSQPSILKWNSAESLPLTPQNFQRTPERFPSRALVARKI